MKTCHYRIGPVVLLSVFFNLHLVAPAWAGGYDNEIEDLVFFGDSLSDSGNDFAANGDVTVSPYAMPVPDKPYAIDGFQFSNGPTWTQVLARAVGRADSGKAVLLDPDDHGNYAFGGARARVTDGAGAPSAPEQLSLYWANNDGEADDETLYFIQFGGNDIRDSLGVLMVTGDIGSAQSVNQAAVDSIDDVARQLYARGARNIRIVNVPNLGLAPAVKLLGPPAAAAATLLSLDFNGRLLGVLEDLRELRGLDVAQVDFFGISNDIVFNSGDYGIADVSSPCIRFFVDGLACDDPNVHFFWDGLHPTARVHAIVGETLAAGLRIDDDDDDDSD